MRQVWITKAGPPEVLKIQNAPDPEPSEGEVRIRVRAIGVNFSDLMARVGLYPDAPKIPCVIGYEVSGTIDAIGANVTGLAVGDRVFGMPRFGGYTDCLVIPAAQVFKMPSKMTFEEGAALPVVYLTAHHMLLFTGHLLPKSTVLIHSAAGGVGLAAIQIAKTRNATIIGTASPAKHDFLRAQGCNYPIDSTGDHDSIARAVRAIVGDRGIDVVLDPVGGKSWSVGYDLLSPCGRLVCFGMSAVSAGKKRNLVNALGQVLQVKKFSPMRLMEDNKTVSGTNMGHLFHRIDLLRPQFEALLKMYENFEIKPHVGKTFPIEEAAAAHHFLHERKAIGKIVLIA